MKFFIYFNSLANFCTNTTCDKESLRREIKRLAQYDNISLLKYRRLTNAMRNCMEYQFQNL